MKPYTYFLLIFCFFQCADSAVQQELEQTKAQLAQTLSALDRTQQKLLNNQPGDLGTLHHLVFLKAKPTANLDALISEIKALRTIPEVKSLEVGPFEELKDDRALSDYNLVMLLKFRDEADYKIYQEHPTHLALIKKTQSLLAGPPATYDFISR